MKSTKDVLKIGDFWEEPVQFKLTILNDGNCRAGHQSGDTFVFSWNTPEGICSESFIGMYPILQSLRVMGDMRELGSPERNTRIYNCPSRVIQFQINALYRCNLCGSTLKIKENGTIGHRLENKAEKIHLRVCNNCYKMHQGKTLTW